MAVKKIHAATLANDDNDVDDVDDDDIVLDNSNTTDNEKDFHEEGK